MLYNRKNVCVRALYTYVYYEMYLPMYIVLRNIVEYS